MRFLYVGNVPIQIQDSFDDNGEQTTVDLLISLALNTHYFSDICDFNVAGLEKCEQLGTGGLLTNA